MKQATLLLSILVLAATGCAEDLGSESENAIGKADSNVENYHLVYRGFSITTAGYDPSGAGELPDVYTEIELPATGYSTTTPVHENTDFTDHSLSVASWASGDLPPGALSEVLVTLWDVDPINDDLIASCALDLSQLVDGPGVILPCGHNSLVEFELLTPR